ncbi:hypothetical protein [Streptomyces hokutonensis]|uniref:hypothetical protein n=1 Tax=Streptomyces hokutonensis TaxID=1306990 RepID=UPI000684B858|nr:hypothetical protein [Streptomyces hokutonensis]
MQREADVMTRRTAVSPVITHDGEAAIRLTHVNGRLRIETVFRRSSRGWKRSDYQLFQDGERRLATATWEEYDALLERLSSDASQPAVLPVLTPLSEQDALPMEILQNLEQCERRLAGREDIAVCVGRDDKGRYVIAISSSKAALHLAFETQRRSGRKGVCVASTNSVRVVTAEGKDLTEEVQGKLAKALTRLMAEPPGTSTAEAGTGGAQGPQGGGPSDRKGTILRL